MLKRMARLHKDLVEPEHEDDLPEVMLKVDAFCESIGMMTNAVRIYSGISRNEIGKAKIRNVIQEQIDLLNEVIKLF